MNKKLFAILMLAGSILSAGLGQATLTASASINEIAVQPMGIFDGAAQKTLAVSSLKASPEISTLNPAPLASSSISSIPKLVPTPQATKKKGWDWGYALLGLVLGPITYGTIGALVGLAMKGVKS